MPRAQNLPALGAATWLGGLIRGGQGQARRELGSAEELGVPVEREGCQRHIRALFIDAAKAPFEPLDGLLKRQPVTFEIDDQIFYGRSSGLSLACAVS
jgi:hypothetical protein